jgi:predicted secreted Zn-dependent protease
MYTPEGRLTPELAAEWDRLADELVEEERVKKQEHRTCSECPNIIDHKNAKQLTCSPKCRKARSRRLAKLKSQ